jgi:hypothetical protein
VLLDAPAESLTLDFKERLEWADPAHRFAIARDIAGFANRTGGRLVIGVSQRGAGEFRAVGMLPDDPLPDATDLNQVLREKFDPAISCEVAYVDVNGTRFGVVQVPEFATYPHVCSREAGTTGGPILRPGDIYVRTDALSTERATPADVRRIIEASVGKTGAAIAKLVGPASQEVPARLEPDDTRVVFDRHPTRRALRLTPIDQVDPVRLSELERRIMAARVTTRGYALLPRYFDPGRVDDALVLREPGRLVFEAEDTRGAQSIMSVVDARSDLSVRVWESLWEDTSPQLGQDKLDVTSVFSFAYAGLLFANRLYSAIGVSRFVIEVGLTSPLGRALVVDHARFTGLFRRYRATSAADLWVRRDVRNDAVNSPEGREGVAAELSSELLEYWGLELNDEGVRVQVQAGRERIDGDFQDEAGAG